MNNLPNADSLWDGDIFNQPELACEAIATMLYDCAKSSKIKYAPVQHHRARNATQRWNNILSSGNDKSLWAAINWNGTIGDIVANNDKPSDVEFCKHFETLLNRPVESDLSDYQPTTQCYIPVLDDPITPYEVDTCIKKLKSNKAAGIDGIPPGIIQLLPDEWIILLTFIFNQIFTTSYPSLWSQLRVFTIFKKGMITDPKNYRGISILSAIPKIYDMILGNRFGLWYTPRVEQAGAQPKRGCEEQILTIRLLMDIARKTKKVLYLAFIDYRQAYDRVNRHKLLQYLENIGCGRNFLFALQHSMNANGVIGTEKFATTTGVKQGGSLSVKLFTAYIDPTIDAVNALGPDDWLESKHILLLMDDTVIMATSREKLQAKLEALKAKADEIGMILHPTKSQYMTVNSVNKEPFLLDDVVINYTESYTYLGAVLSNTSLVAQISQHMKAKQSHMRKFTSFLMKNSDAPYTVKIKVWNSALNAAILYSSETWLTGNLRSVESSYVSTLKQLLSVRNTTCTDLVYIETGLANARSVIQDKQVKFLRNLRIRHTGDYIAKTVDEAIALKTPMGKAIRQLESSTSWYS